MAELSRRKFMAGTGATVFGALAGCTSEDSEDPSEEEDDNSSNQITASEPEVDGSVTGDVPEEFIDAVRDASYYQKAMLNEINEIDGEWYDVESLNNTVYSGGSLREEERQEDDAGSFDVLTTTEMLSGETSMADMEDVGNGEYLLSGIVENALSLLTNQQIYRPIRGQEGEEYHDPETYEIFEENLSGLGYEIRDDEGSTAELYIPEDDVEDLWETMEEAAEEGTVKETRNEDILAYVEENVEYSIN